MDTTGTTRTAFYCSLQKEPHLCHIVPTKAPESGPGAVRMWPAGGD